MVLTKYRNDFFSWYSKRMAKLIFFHENLKYIIIANTIKGQKIRRMTNLSLIIWIIACNCVTQGNLYKPWFPLKSEGEHWVGVGVLLSLSGVGWSIGDRRELGEGERVEEPIILPVVFIEVKFLPMHPEKAPDLPWFSPDLEKVFLEGDEIDTLLHTGDCETELREGEDCKTRTFGRWLCACSVRARRSAFSSSRPESRSGSLKCYASISSSFSNMEGGTLSMKPE